MIRKSLALIVVLFLAACETSPRPALRWVKPGAGAEDLETDRQACVDEAMKPQRGLDSDHLQSQARANTFMRCMKARDWQQVLPEGES